MPGDEQLMRAAVYEGEGNVAVRSLPVPSPSSGEVLVEISHCGICGSDLHFVIEGWSAPGSVHGHEYSGVIVETGPAVAGWSVGDRVVGGPDRGCGGCGPCRSGRTNLCVHRSKPGMGTHQGAFATYKLLKADHLFRVPDGVDLRTAALTEPLAVALRGVRRSGVGPGARVLVTGGGPIGQLTVAVLRASGVDDVVVSEPAPTRQRLAEALGATVVEPSSLAEPSLPMDLVDAPFDAAIECSGRADAMTAALAQLDRGGVLVFSGTGMNRPKLEVLRVILNELLITGSFEYSRDDYDGALGLLADGRLPVDLLIEPVAVPLEGVQAAMERLAAGQLAAKVMVTPGA
jgi:2-desacetyl-2-hydroxyethyl bacteriochlorophyllide A dehydrogenase